ncbi:MAG: tRNA 2-thiouridine(34) synthase MnmA [Acidimicrobiales bacterium]
MRVLVAMSGGVDSSVAAALAIEAGHEVVGATLKLWGGASDSGCCSVADVDDARRVAEQLGVAHHVFNFTEVFEHRVVGPYVDGHAAGRTPNPCIECNRHVKFGVLLERARRMGFDALATGHHARALPGPGGGRLLRGADQAKDQSYVLSMLTAEQLGSILLPIGTLTKVDVRSYAARLDLRTAAKPDSQDVCFIHSDAGRGGFLAERVSLNPGELVDADSGEQVGTVPAVELVTVGQRRGLGLAGDGRRRFALSVDVAARRVTVGEAARARSRFVPLRHWTWVDQVLPTGSQAIAQTSAHGRPVPCTLGGEAIVFDEPQRLVAPGQTVALYDAESPDVVLGSAIVASAPPGLADR